MMNKPFLNIISANPLAYKSKLVLDIVKYAAQKSNATTEGEASSLANKHSKVLLCNADLTGAGLSEEYYPAIPNGGFDMLSVLEKKATLNQAIKQELLYNDKIDVIWGNIKKLPISNISPCYFPLLVGDLQLLSSSYNHIIINISDRIKGEALDAFLNVADKNIVLCRSSYSDIIKTSELIHKIITIKPKSKIWICFTHSSIEAEGIRAFNTMQKLFKEETLSSINYAGYLSDSFLQERQTLSPSSLSIIQKILPSPKNKD